MNKRELLNGIIAAMTNTPSTNFSAEEVNDAAVNAIMKECGLSADSTPREIRAKQDLAFALVEEAIDEILPKKLENVLGGFAEIKTFARDAEVVFNIEKIGKQRAKLTISRGARAGIYRAARLDSKFFSPKTEVYTAAVYVTLEELILGTASLAELYANILEGLEEVVYKEVFNALASGSSASGYNAMTTNAIVTSSETLTAALDTVMPKVRQYGIPTIFGSYKAISHIANGGVDSHIADTADLRKYGFVQEYKGVKVVELPNYLVDNGNDSWVYEENKVFVIPSGIKPVKVALKGELMIQRNADATGSEKWEAHKIMGVGLAMANNYAVITVTDL